MRKFIFTVCSITILSSFALSDSGPMPQNWIQTSENERYELLVKPAKNRFLLPDRKHCIGILFENTSDGSQKELWRINMENPVSPSLVIISNDGEYVITQNDWGKSGYGENVIVIYQSDGTLLGKYSLLDFVTQDEIDNMLHTASSILWGNIKFWDEESRELNIRVGTSDVILKIIEGSIKRVEQLDSKQSNTCPGKSAL